MEQAEAEKVLNIKISAVLHKKLKILATIKGVSMKEITELLIKEYCKNNDEINFNERG